MKLLVFWISISLLSTFQISFCQTVIELENPSFEGKWESDGYPKGWIEVSDHTTLDKCPGRWGIQEVPFDGRNYILMTTRYDGSSEMIGQKLNSPLLAGKTYIFSVTLAMSSTFEVKPYKNSVKLRVIGAPENILRLSEANAHEFEALGETYEIDHHVWKQHVFKVKPIQDIHLLVFQALCLEDRLPYDGHFLIDLISPITEIERKKKGSDYKRILNERFEGGAEAFTEYFNLKIEFPLTARENCRLGVLKSRLAINAEGDEIEVEFLNSIDNTIENVVSRVFLSTKGSWKKGKNKDEFDLSIAFNTDETLNIHGDLIVTAFVYPKKELCPSDDFYVDLVKESFKNKDYKLALEHVEELLRRHPESNKFQQMQKVISSKMED